MHRIEGQKFGRLTAIRPTDERKDAKIVWEFLCDCGETCYATARDVVAGHTSSCGCLKREICYERNGPNHPNYKGGRKLDHLGYVHVLTPGHPRAAGRRQPYVREHILIMEGKIGRHLRAGETVHHVNGIRDDNRPENLELWDSNHPAGQRVEDKIAWCREYLASHPEPYDVDAEYF